MSALPDPVFSHPMNAYYIPGDYEDAIIQVANLDGVQRYFYGIVHSNGVTYGMVSSSYSYLVAVSVQSEEARLILAAVTGSRIQEYLASMN